MQKRGVLLVALQKQNIPVSFAQGLDTKTDPKQVILGKLLTLENRIFIKPGQLTKRNGHVKLGSIGSAGYGAGSFIDELLGFDGNSVLSYSSATGDFKNKGNAVSIEALKKPVISNQYAQTSQDGCYHSAGIRTYVWEDSRGGVRYSVIDDATGQQLVADAVVDASGASPRVFALGNYVIIVYYVSPGLSYKAFSVATPTTLGAKTAINTNVVAANPKWDGQIIGQRLFIGWNSTVTAVSVCYLTPTLVVSAAVDKNTEVGTGGVTVFGDSIQNCWVAYYNGTKVRVFMMSYDLGTTLAAPTDVETVANVVNLTGSIMQDINGSSNKAILFYQISATNSYDHFVKACILLWSATSVSAGTPAVFLRSVGLASKCFRYNDAVYVGLAYDSSVQPSYFLARTTNVTTALSWASPNLVARIVSQGGGGLTKKVILPGVWSISTSDFMIAWLQKDSLNVQSGVIFTNTGVVSVTVSFLSKNTFLRASMGRNLHITGGFLSMYDGVSVVEHGFHVYPEQAAAPSQATTTGFIAPGTYSYCFVYAWTDNQGNIHRSAPSIPQQVTVPAGTSTNKVTWALPTLRLTSKRSAFSRSDCIVEVYRTQASGTIYYKVTSTSSPTVNDPTADTVSFADTLADATIIGNELLYTTGGVLENIAAPACSLISTYKDSMIIVPSENKQTFWVSKPNVPGTAVEFSDFFEKPIDARDGDITAGAQMDEKFVFFKLNTCWVTAGDGPSATGAQDGMAKPELVQTDAGCVDQRSVVMTPNGLMRKSLKGIYLLDRSLQDNYIGKDVEAFNDQNITSAILVPETNQVRFTTDGGMVLVYDYLFDQWSTFTNVSAVDATVFENSFCYLNASGNFYQETPGIFTDDSAFIPSKIKTSWLSFAGLQGFQRVWQMLILGEFKSPHRLKVRAAYDFNPSMIQEMDFDAATLLGPTTYGADSPYGAGTPYGGPFPLYQFRMFMTKQKCQAIQIEIEEFQDGNYGEGFSLSGMNFSVGKKSGAFKVDPTRSFA